MKKMGLLTSFISLLLFASCGGSNDEPSPTPTPDPVNPDVTVVEKVTSDLALSLITDKCSYAPGQTVTFKIINGSLPSGAHVRYRHLGTTVEDVALTSDTWTWTVPSNDYRGYMAEVYTQVKDKEVKIHGTIGVDVSSDWTTFPRYGFVATFDDSKTDALIQSEIEWLNRCHINGVQFQDWHYSHHWPCPIDKNGKLMDHFKDIANRDNSTAVIKKYIDVQHGYGMKTMFYNLCFGVLDGAAEDGVKDNWYIFKEKNNNAGARDSHNLPSSWKSNIYLVNPGNTEWQKYLADRNEEVYSNFDFDGYQIDQLGDRGDRYDYSKNKVNLLTGYTSFIKAMAERHPKKRLVMNAVSGWGTQQIVNAGKVDFLYNEVWGDQDKFTDLYNIVKENNAYSGSKLKTVFAAYMNYECDNCEFNIPGVLLTDAVMFALGSTHLELGDHMLCREYFPYTGVRMSKELKTQMERYYDFLVAYENILMGDGKEISLTPSSTSITINAWPPVQRQVAAYSREVGGNKVVNLINFINATSLSWRDLKGDQAAAKKRSNIDMKLKVSGAVKKVWVATPDEHAGAAQELAFTLKNGELSFTLPSLRYWTMLVIE